MAHSISKLLLSFFLIASVLDVKSQTVPQTPPYNQFRVSNGLVFISGQTGISVINNKLVDSSFDMEVAEAMQRIKKILQKTELDFSDLISVTVYLKDIKQYEAFNKVYMKYFNSQLPTRNCIAVKDIPKGAHIEIAAIAEIKK